MTVNPKRLAKLAADSIIEATILLSFTSVGYKLRARMFGWNDFWNPIDRPLADKTVVVTGATGGLGSEMALAFAKLGANVWVTGRSESGLAKLKSQIQAECPDATVNTYELDLASLSAVRAFAETLKAQCSTLDVLIHNAGALTHKFESTSDGIEITAQVHVVAPFVLSAELLPLLRATPNSRVLTTSSGGMYTKAVTAAALSPDGNTYNGLAAYAMAKRAQVVLTKKWESFPAASGVHFQAMHPGWADTPGIRASLPGFYKLIDPLLRTARQGIDTMVWLSVDDQALQRNGAFWFDRRKRRTVYLPKTQTSQSVADELWDWCLERGGISFGNEDAR